MLRRRFRSFVSYSVAPEFESFIFGELLLELFSRSPLSIFGVLKPCHVQFLQKPSHFLMQYDHVLYTANIRQRSVYGRFYTNTADSTKLA